MTDREAMNQAWATEEAKNPHTAYNSWCRGYEAALAQEQTKCPRCGKVNPAEIHTCSPQIAHSEQEPVAWMYVNENNECEQIEYGEPFDDPYVTPLYTTPPSKQWVGLTVEEIKEMLYGLRGDDRTPMLALIDAVQRKLKEKNGG